MIEDDSSEKREQKKKLYCQRTGKCNFQFQAIETSASQEPTVDTDQSAILSSGGEEKISKAILYCTHCGFIDDLNFEDF